MFSTFAVGLIVASSAAAQQIIATGSVVSSMLTSMPPMATPDANNYGSGGYNPSPAESAYSSEVTEPPSYSSSSMDEQAYYSTFTSEGYKSMDCGYGYSKGSDGKCNAQSWVRLSVLLPSSLNLPDICSTRVNRGGAMLLRLSTTSKIKYCLCILVAGFDRINQRLS